MFIGVDIGTTNIKIGVFDEKFNNLFFSSVDTPKDFDQKLGIVVNIEKLTANLLELFESIPSKYKNEICSIGISSFGETVFPLIKNEKFYTPVSLIWYNEKTKKEMNEFLSRGLDEKELFSITGLHPSWVFSIFKMIFFYKHFPELRNNDHKWLDLASSVVFNISDKGFKVGIDRSLASRTMAINLSEEDWDTEILERAGIPRWSLPNLVQPGEIRGILKKNLREKVGFKKEVILTTAGQDHITALYGMGLNKSEFLNSSGTTEVLLWNIEKNEIEKFVNSNAAELQGGLNIEKQRYYILGGIPTGAFCIEWFTKKFLDGDFNKLYKIPFKTNSIFFFPYLRTAFEDKKYSGALINIDDNSDIQEIISAIYEGISFEVLTLLKKFRDIYPSRFEKIIGVGGGNRLNEFVKVKSSILELPIVVPKFKEGVVKGAAIIAAKACNKLSQVPRYKEKEIFAPIHDNEDYFKKKYEKYIKLRREIYGI